MDSLVKQTLLALPKEPLEDLLHSGACTSCAFRFLNVRSRVYLPSTPTAFTVCNELKSHFSGLQTLEAPPSEVCTVCLGVLQWKDSFQSIFWDAVQEYEFDSFSLEVTLPPATLVRERSLWCHLKKKHSACNRFTAEDPNDGIVSLKEAVKWLFGPQLETFMKKESNKDSKFRISIVFKHSASASDASFLSEFLDSKRKRGSAAETGESIAAVQRTLSSISDETFSRHFPCPPPKVDTSFEMLVSCRREAVLVVGRYLKYSRNISQSPWNIGEERKGEGSVQEIIADVIFPPYKADSYKFHTAGREDIDVRMLGNGRPFILELANARTCLSQMQLVKLQEVLNTTKAGWVNVLGLKEAGTEAWAFMKEGEADKQKDYTAVVWLSRPVTDSDFEVLSNIKDLEIQQKTPIRVLHRRSPLVRPRTIHRMQCERLHDSENYFLLHLCTQAGTYIKEFVHSDMGRTYPSVGSLLSCEADILCLDVTNVKMDFL